MAVKFIAACVWAFFLPGLPIPLRTPSRHTCLGLSEGEGTWPVVQTSWRGDWNFFKRNFMELEDFEALCEPGEILQT